MKRLLSMAMILYIVTCTRIENNQGVMDQYVNTGVQQQIEELTQSKIGHFVVDLAEVSMRVTGAIDSLRDGVKAFGRQIEERLKLENTQWEAVEGEHNAKVISLSSQANQAEFDINREKKVLNSELIPRLHELDDILLGLKAKQTDNTQSFKEAEAARNTQNQSFQLTTTEFTDALRNIDEALDLLTDLFKSGDVRAAFIQITDEQKHKINKSLKQVKSNTENFGHQYSSFIQALTNLTERFDFKDRQVLNEICDFLNSLRLNIFDALTKAYKDEDSQKYQHSLRTQQLTAEKTVFDQQYADFYQEREDKTVRISDVQTMISTRQADLKAYQDRLRTQNNNYSANLKIHDDIVASVQQELAVLAKALQLVQTPPFLDFLNARITKA
ncbi:unnamed protein product (macronuclear) [Paramecium tetraurelia]|uniref:Uncharacterized protein n=1 Tax=Paramecium tetraurelia TaxID=5888 RepID=A0E9R9_PARTE|nr:uncharacterized protein GSPATT00024767001 [Paramecium tetraurelia]CAK92036.1 unnamed protein product [Paramecium tetraurelia]|eukprot:XP_001459433.1 hypothetical protein (macronuclear) [Paramecium tetraurelia strain d4-2]